MNKIPKLALWISLALFVFFLIGQIIFTLPSYIKAIDNPFESLFLIFESIIGFYFMVYIPIYLIYQELYINNKKNSTK